MNTRPAQGEQEQRPLPSNLHFDEVPVSYAASWGTRLLPYLFALMETCWVDVLFIGLASLGFLTHTLLFPLWSPFLFIACLYWLSTQWEQHTSRSSSPATLAVYALLAYSVLSTLWSGIYTSSFALFDPRWLAALLNDILFLDANAFHAAGLLLLCVYFCWRGVRLSRSPREPSNISKTLRIGLLVLIAVILLRAVSGSQANELTLLLLVPIFFTCVLVAHSLAQAALLRQSHPSGLQGSVRSQENALLSIVALIGLALLLIALFTGAVASPAFLAQVQHFFAPIAFVYDLIAHAIAFVATLIFTPFIWLFQFLHIKPGPAPNVHRPPQGPQLGKPSTQAQNDIALSLLVQFIEFALPVLILILVIVVVRLFLRRRRLRLNHQQDDHHESLWSWHLFWTQVRRLLAMLLRHLSPTRHTQTSQVYTGELTGPPAARSIREIYRALLRWSAARGLARTRVETPYEFQSRLDTRLPFVEPELSTITDAYAAIRYGNMTPDPHDVERVTQAWTQLQQKQVSPDM
jgi:hypothetical protein